MNPKFEEYATNVIVNCKSMKDDVIGFLCAYRKFVTPQDLLNLCLKLTTDKTAEEFETIRESVVEFLLQWLSLFMRIDFNGEQRKKIFDDLLAMNLIRNNEFKLLIIRVNRKQFNKMVCTRQRADSLPPNIGNLLVTSKSASLIGSPSKTKPSHHVLSLTPSQIALALTMYDSKIFCKLDVGEFMIKTGWIKSHKETTNLDLLSKRFNEISLWVTSEVVGCGDKTQQVVNTEKFVEIAKRCEELNNFHGVLAIFTGLNHSSVQRLKQLWEGVSDRHKKDYQSLETLLSPNSNFKNYRTQLQERPFPLLPFCGLFLRDLTFLSENEIYLSDGSVNTEMLKLITKILNCVQMCKANPYKFEPLSNSLDLVTSLFHIEDEEILRRLSLKSEPSRWDKTFIAPFIDITNSNENSQDFSETRFTSKTL